ncbi:MAG: primosomal protein N' [Balneola sp.]|nr:MAG: primosomal protein N' [Balneola sp.]
MGNYADIAFPSAVRRLFTYQVPKALQGEIKPGMRVWVPFRTYNAIGVVVKLHNQKPDFEIKAIREVLDQSPVLDTSLFKLTEWVHQFYFASWGEVIQAALPSGLNFVSKEFVRINPDSSTQSLSEKEQQVVNEISMHEKLTLLEANKRWRNSGFSVSKLIKKGALEVWEEPFMKVDLKTEKEWDWAEGKSAHIATQFLQSATGRPAKWKTALSALAQSDLPKRDAQLSAIPEFNSTTKRRLQDDGWIQFKKVEKEFNLELEYVPGSIKELNKEQREAFQAIGESISKEQFENYLLYGITGSGKTEVYIHALNETLKMQKGGIILVPEISLTPQTVSRFYKVFGDEIAVLHSRMSDRERLQAWNALKSGKKKIAIGARSAIFAPVQNLGLIVIDEEHDGSYKQEDPSPRYHARETAIMRASMGNAVVIMGSATPSMQALHMAAKGKCQLLSLTTRHADARLPDVEIVDLKQYSGAMKGNLAISLFNAVENALSKKEQVILLFNRRGFASYLQCGICGHIPQSPECSVSLTYHKRRNLLLCHYSGYSRRADTHCEKCGSGNLLIRGSGTQQVEENLEELFPKAKILRFDKDSTSNKGAHEKILAKFGNHEADILIGTQLVAKGLDFPNVTVVGVIDADTEYAFPSFQSHERMYQLLSQVSGRSGRGEKPGKVFIQTRQPENPAIQFAKFHDHEGFAKEEMGFRKPLNYPPYSRLIKFVLKGKKEHEVITASESLKNIALSVVPDIELLGPSASSIGWMNNNYIWELLLKLDPEKGGQYIEAVLSKIMEVYSRKSGLSSSKVRININVDAVR